MSVEPRKLFTAARRKRPRPSIPRSVFIVHGHNDGMAQTVARVLEKVDLKVSILHELPNEGRTIIEKFVDSSDVGFAVILLTGDDRGGVKTASFEDQKPRARQNVILELGYFLGKLERHKVCVIYEDEVEIPSDYQGVLFIPYDKAGGWKYRLANELQAAGIPVDKNKID